MKKNTRFFLGIFLVILIIITTNVWNKYELEKNKSQTVGKIIKFRYNSSGNFIINYSFIVDSVKYIGTQSVKYFKCDDGVEGCVGSEFTIYYSIKNPKNNDIDLKEFNKVKF